MGCPRRFELTRYHAEDLVAAEAEAVQEHVVECKRCSGILEGMDRRRQEFLRRYPPDQIVPEILAEAERREQNWWWRLRVWWWIKRGYFRP